MRILDRPVVGRRGAIGGAVKSRHDNGRTSHRCVLAHGCLHDPRSKQPRGRCLSRLPPACRHRMVTPSERGGRATRIRAHLVTAWKPDNRGPHRFAVDGRPGIPGDRRRSGQARAAGLAYGCEPGLPGELQGGQSQPRAWQLRCFMCRLCHARQGRRTAFWRLPGRISIRPARLRTRRTARADALRGEHVSQLRDFCRAGRNTCAG